MHPEASQLHRNCPPSLNFNLLLIKIPIFWLFFFFFISFSKVHGLLQVPGKGEEGSFKSKQEEMITSQGRGQGSLAEKNLGLD